MRKPPRFLYVDERETPATAYPREKLGCAEISSYNLHRGTYEMYGVNGYKYFVAEKKLKGTELLIKRKVWMVDDPPHYYAMLDHAQHYKGHVLCAGLGLGLIVHALSENPRVKQITVIEREQDVINLVGPQLPRGNKIKILHGDFWDLNAWVMDKVDGVFYDLFVGDGKELWPQAMRVWFELHEAWPRTVRRIHGFNNEQLESLDKLIERL